MQTLFFHASSAAVGGVAVVLVLGLRSLLRDGSASRSQQLMRWRVGLQAIAITAILLYALLRQQAV